jgi:hypothetical protein
MDQRVPGFEQEFVLGSVLFVAVDLDSDLADEEVDLAAEHLLSEEEGDPMGLEAFMESSLGFG